jgi:hypothetical protein
VKRELVVHALAIAVMVCSPAIARADLDPSKAGVSPEELGFCTTVKRPLSPGARRFCARAASIPTCKAFVDACSEAPPKSDPEPPPKAPDVQAPSAVGGIARVILWLVIAVAIAFVAVAIVRAIARMRRESKLAESPPADKPATVETHAAPEPLATGLDPSAILARAADLARRGDLDAALHTYLAAALRALDARGAIHIARDRTNGEYVRGCKDGEACAPLREIVLEVDKVQFGGTRADAESVSRASRAATILVRGAVAFSLAIALFACGGRPSGGGGGSVLAAKGADPAGNDRFFALLDRQGVKVKPLDRPLVRLDAEKPDADAAVLVFASRVKLDDETEQHLEQWVSRGGTLILVGAPWAWPDKFGAKPTLAPDRDVVVPYVVRKTKKATSVEARAKVVDHDALDWPDALSTAYYDDAGKTQYAGFLEHGEGRVLGIASDELLANAELAVPGNAEAIVAIFAQVEPELILVAQPEHGISPPANPVASVARAGLGLGLLHGLAATLVLFFAVGRRLTRPVPKPPPPRRAFAEHVEATGALYARARMAPHALAAYARFVEERMRARAVRGGDVPTALATLARADAARCQEIWSRAALAREGHKARGDELHLLKELAALYRAAVTE